MRKIVCAVIIMSLVLLVGAAAAQQFGAGSQQYGAGTQPQYGAGTGQQYGAGTQQPAQQPASAGQSGVLNIPPAPAKPVVNMAYGNTERAAILGQQLSDASQGNAKVYVAENPNKTVSLDVKLQTSGDPYSLAGTMANLTYMVDNIYSYTELKGSDILLTVYDTSGNVITSAKFSDAKNAFEYYDVPQQAAAQPTTGQPATGQPVMGQPATGQPATGQAGVSQPVTGGAQQGIRQPVTGGASGYQPGTGSSMGFR